MSKSALEISEKNLVASVQNWSELVALVEANRDNATLVYVDSAGKLPLASATVAATGTIISDATALTEQINVITDADGAKGVILPVATEDSVVIVINSNASSDLLVYPVLLSQINALGASNAFTVSSGQTATFVGRSAILWNTAEMSNVVAGLTASGAEINKNDVTAQAETIDSGMAASVLIKNTKVDNTTSGAGAITLGVPDATMYGLVKTIEMTVADGDVTLALTNVQGGTEATTATFAAVNDCLVLIGGTSKWHVIGESGVVLS